MNVRAKFECVERTETAEGFSVKMLPVTGGSPENEQFYKWTPAGSILLSTVNKSAGEAFKPGTKFYVDFTPAD